jgi:hypothetical protein
MAIVICFLCFNASALVGCGGQTFDGSRSFYDRDTAPSYVHSTPKYMRPDPDDPDGD